MEKNNKDLMIEIQSSRSTLGECQRALLMPEGHQTRTGGPGLTF